MKRRRLWWMAGAAGVVAAVSLLMVPAFGDGPITAELGTVRLHLDSDGDKVIFDPTAPGSNQIQTLTAPNCKLTSTGASLVGFAASATQANKNPFPGLKDHRIGVGQNGEGTGEPCARINKDLGQVLKLSLTGGLDGQVVGYAELDLGFKFNGSATIQLFRAGVKVGGDITVPCSGSSDCGPDSGASDNERVILFLDPADNPGAGHWQAFPIAGIFDTISIKPGMQPKRRRRSSRWRADPTARPPGQVGVALNTDDTLFELVESFDGEIDCGEDETQRVKTRHSTSPADSTPMAGAKALPTVSCSISRRAPKATSSSSTSSPSRSVGHQWPSSSRRSPGNSTAHPTSPGEANNTAPSATTTTPTPERGSCPGARGIRVPMQLVTFRSAQYRFLLTRPFICQRATPHV